MPRPDTATDIYRRLGEEYQDGDEVLAVVAMAVAEPITRVEEAVITLQDKLTAEGAPAAWLRWLTARIGWPVGSQWPEHVQRKVVERAAYWRANYGKAGIIEEIVYEFTRPAADQEGVTISLREPLASLGGYRVGLGRVGTARVHADNQSFWIYVRIVDAGPYQIEPALLTRLKALLADLLPAWTAFAIVLPATEGGWRSARGYVGTARVGHAPVRVA